MHYPHSKHSKTSAITIRRYTDEVYSVNFRNEDNNVERGFSKDSMKDLQSQTESLLHHPSVQTLAFLFFSFLFFFHNRRQILRGNYYDGPCCQTFLFLGCCYKICCQRRQQEIRDNLHLRLFLSIGIVMEMWVQ